MFAVLRCLILSGNVSARCAFLSLSCALLLHLREVCTSDVNKDWTCKDKDKDQAYRDQDKDKD